MADDSRIASILGDWIEQRDRGEEVAPEEVIAAHPEFADELRRRFRALSLMEDALSDETGSARLYPMRDGRYGDYKVAGEGGMGIVYWALDTDLNRQVAFKIVKPQGDGGGEAPSAPLLLAPPGKDTPASNAFETLKARFLQEAWVTAGLEHPGIVPVYELGETAEGVPYYTMRFVRGSRTLAGAIEEATDFDQRLALLEPFLKVCDTIRYAHAHGVIHRDLKPENVAIGEFGEVVVLDWGLAKLKGQEDAAAEVWQERLTEYREATDLRTVAGALGTPGYMSLEAALGEVEKVDERSDVYSLGAMLYQLLTGRLPHTFTSYGQMVGVMLEETPVPAHEVDPQIPVDLSMICASALAREKAARFASARDLAEAVRRWQRESAVAREVRELLAKAEAAFEGTEGLGGETLLKQLDRVTSACSRIREKVPDQARAVELVTACDSLRSKAIAERERAARGQLLRRVAVAAVILLTAVGAVVVLAVDAKRKEAEGARAETAVALAQSRALGLVHASADAGRTDPMLGLLLAREAIVAERTPLSVSRLRSAIGRSRESTMLGFEGAWAFSPSGDRFFAAGSRGLILWDLEGRLVKAIPIECAEVSNFVIAPDDESVLTAFSDGRATVWDLEGNAMLRLHHGEQIEKVVFSPTGDRILTVSNNGRVKLWRLDGECLAERVPGEYELLHAGFGQSSSRVVLIQGDGQVHRWSESGGDLPSFRIADWGERPIERASTRRHLLCDQDQIITSAGECVEFSGKPVGRFCRENVDNATPAALSPDGGLAVFIQQRFGFPLPNGKRCVYPGDREAEIRALGGRLVGRIHAETPIEHALFSPRGDQVLTMHGSGEIRFWDLEGSDRGVIRGSRYAGFDSISFSRDGDLLLSPGEFGVRLSYVRMQEPVIIEKAIELLPSSGQISGGVTWGTPADAFKATFSDAGDLVLTTEGDEHALSYAVWDLSGHKRHVLTLPAKEGVPGSRRVSTYSRGRLLPDGRRVVAVNGDKTAWILDPERQATPLRGHSDYIRSLEVSPGGDRVLTVSWDRTARLWSLEGREMVTIVMPEMAAGKWANLTGWFTPGGDRVLISCGDGTTRLFDLKGRELSILDSGGGIALFARDGDRIITASRDIRVWDRDGTRTAVFGDLGDEVTFGSSTRVGEAVYESLDISPDGSQLIVLPSGLASWGEGPAMMDFKGKVRAWPTGHEARVSCVAFTPVGDLVVTASLDGIVKLWSYQGELIEVIQAHERGVTSVAFTRDGSRLLTVGGSTVRVWRVRADDLLRFADTRITRDFTPEELRLYGDLLGTAAEDGDH